MPSPTRARRIALARKRLASVLRQHTVAIARTLEQKISDAGPLDQRIDPHILTRARNAMVQDNELSIIQHTGTNWYALPQTDPTLLQQRLADQASTFKELTKRAVNLRIGQTLEIATYRALQTLQNAIFLGRFKDLDDHGDHEIYRKEEPPQHLGSRELSGDQRLDFLVLAPSGICLGLECKNIREWLYPDRGEVRETISKCLQLNCVPVIIARRIPFVTFRLLRPCGVIVHQTYNQLFPASEHDLAERARHKRNLGYHDIRLGNTPDSRLMKFIGTNLLAVAEGARSRFEEYKDLLSAFVADDTGYDEFAARVRRRERGLLEDNDWEEEDPADWSW